MNRQPVRWWRIALLVLATGALLGVPAAHAVAADSSSATIWSQMQPGDDWSSRVLHSMFPMTANTAIGNMLKWLSTFAMGLATTWVFYACYMQVHKTTETGKVVSASFNAWAPVKLTWAVLLLLPIQNGFSFGQMGVLALGDIGIGLARTEMDVVADSIGPKALPIAEPIIPGTQKVVEAVMLSELCRSLVNKAANNPNLMPVPKVLTKENYVEIDYGPQQGNGDIFPVCGSVSLTTPWHKEATGVFSGQWVSLGKSQQQALLDLVKQVRPQMDALATQLWQSRDGSYLSQMDAILVDRTQSYTDAITTAASAAIASIRAKGGQSDSGLDAVKALGWTGLGTYYLEIGRINGDVLSMTSILPSTTAPNWSGFGGSLMTDLQPFIPLIQDYQTKAETRLQTADVASAPNGAASLYGDSSLTNQPEDVFGRALGAVGVSNKILTEIVNHIVAPSSGDGWTDPFANMLSLGHLLIHTSLLMIGGAAVLSSKSGSAAALAGSLATGNVAGAVASVTGFTFSGVIKALLAPIFAAAAGLLLPGLTLAYVLPMAPIMYWMAGVAGWYITIIELMVGVPLWALAHMTFAGDGLHGKGIRGYEYLLTIVLRPAMMVVGLVFSYNVFSPMSWLILKSFTVASGFVLSQGFLADNLLGIVMMLGLFVTLEIAVATLSFRLISTLPHHIVGLLNMTSIGRVDSDEFNEKTTGRGIETTRERAGEIGKSAVQQLGHAAGGKTPAEPRKPE